MAQTDNPFLDGMARIFTDAAGAAKSVRDEIDTFVRQRLERLVADMISSRARSSKRSRRWPPRRVPKTNLKPPASLRWRRNRILRQPLRARCPARCCECPRDSVGDLRRAVSDLLRSGRLVLRVR